MELLFIDSEQKEKLQKLGCNETEDLPVTLALTWIRKNYKMYPTYYSRSFSEENPIGYSIGWNLLFNKFGFGVTSDLSEYVSEDLYANWDGIAAFDFDKAECVALTEALNYLLSDTYKYHISKDCGTIPFEEWKQKRISKN